MSLPRRRRLVEVARERELLVLEDNPYGLLRYEGDAVPTLRELDGGVYVMYLGTFSKILSPGIRLGWVLAPPPVLEKINLGKQAADLCSSTLSQLMVIEYFAGARWRDYIDSVAERYRARRDTMLDALAEHFPREAEWTHPQGGLFIWATLPDYIDTTDLLARALRRTSRSFRALPRTWTAAGTTRCGSTSRRSTRATSARACGGSARSWASRSRCTAR